MNIWNKEIGKDYSAEPVLKLKKNAQFTYVIYTSASYHQRHSRRTCRMFGQ